MCPSLKAKTLAHIASWNNSVWDAGKQRPAYETLDPAADLAGGDQDFLIKAGEQFHMRQAWIASAVMYLRFMKLVGLAEEFFNRIP